MPETMFWGLRLKCCSIKKIDFFILWQFKTIFSRISSSSKTLLKNSHQNCFSYRILIFWGKRQKIDKIDTIHISQMIHATGFNLLQSRIEKLHHENKNTGIPSMKIPLNIARQNHYLYSHCKLTVMISLMMSQAICCKKYFSNK